MLTTTALYSGLLPLLVAAGVVLLAGRLGSSPGACWAWSVGVAFIAALFGFRGPSGFSIAFQRVFEPLEAVDWLPFTMLLALGASLLLLSAQSSIRPLAFALAAILIVAVPLRLVSGNYRLSGEWSVSEKLAYLALMAGTLGIIWRLLAGGAGQPAAARIVCLIIVAVGMAVVLVLSGDLAYGQLSGALAATLVGSALVCTFSPRANGFASDTSRLAFPGFTGAAGIIACALVSLIILGHFTASLTFLNAALLTVAIAAAGAPWPTAAMSLPAWLRFALRAAACLFPLAIAVVNVAT